jgi:hypothetical protein
MADNTPLPTVALERPCWQQAALALAPAFLTLVLAVVVSLVGVGGVDQAAQAYRVWVARHHGFTLWDSGWYGGNLPPGYSFLFPFVGALIGLTTAAISSAVLAVWAFDRVVTRHFGSRPLGSWYFAVTTLLPLAIGQLPFLAGEAFGLCALAALQRNRKTAAVALGLISALFSPLAAAFLAMVCLAWAVYALGRRGWLIATAGVALAVIGVIGLAFPGDGPEPFSWNSLVVTELLCLTALTPLVRTTPAVRLGALLYGASSLFSYLVPNPLGGNAPRLAASVGIPLLACFVTAPGRALDRLSLAEVINRLSWARRMSLSPLWRPAAIGLIIPFAFWQWSPTSQLVVKTSASAPYAKQSFFQPLVTELELVSNGPIRVEVVPTADHWEAAYVAPYVSLARGWERQLDIADNPIFYTQGALTPASYAQWLDDNGISFVALPTAPLDYAARLEAEVIESGQVPNLVKIWTTPDWTLWRVQGSPGLVSGPAVLTGLQPDRVTLEVTQPGPVLLRIRYTDFWTVSVGSACLSEAEPGNWTEVDALAAGEVQLDASVVHSTAPPGCPPGTSG